jgi:hypothetical protein
MEITDFKIHFRGDLVCKVELGGKYGTNKKWAHKLNLFNF